MPPRKDLDRFASALAPQASKDKPLTVIVLRQLRAHAKRRRAIVETDPRKIRH
jgi:hypothetical protein